MQPMITNNSYDALPKYIALHAAQVYSNSSGSLFWCSACNRCMKQIEEARVLLSLKIQWSINVHNTTANKTKSGEPHKNQQLTSSLQTADHTLYLLYATLGPVAKWMRGESSVLESVSLISIGSGSTASATVVLFTEMLLSVPGSHFGT